MKRRIFFLTMAAIGLAPALLRASDAETKPGSHRDTLLTAGGKRDYILHIPARYDGKTPLPLVVFLHGRGGNGAQAERSYGWSELADRENFAVCYPTATPDRQGSPTWNAGYNAGAAGRADDLGFLSDLIRHLKKTVAIDDKRVFMSGHSSGAMMSYRFAAERTDEVSAIGVVSGSIGNDSRLLKDHVPQPKQPISVIAFHGKVDTIVPYDYHVQSGAGMFSQFIPAPESVRFFASADGCNKTPKRAESFGGNIVEESFANGRNGTEVVFYTVMNGGHSYPGAKSRVLLRPTDPPNQQINATNLIWEFFKKHSRS